MAQGLLNVELMHFSSRNIAIVGRLSLVLFFLANAGFTYVLQECNMRGMPGGMMCCDEQGQASAGSSANVDPDPARNATLDAGNAGCMVMIVVGGLQTDPKFVEKEASGPHLSKISFVPVSITIIPGSPNVDGPFSLNSSAFPRVSPPCVEKYVLTASYLI